MVTAREAAEAKTPLASDLAAGVDTLSLDQEITFTLYVKVVLPADKFVFWVRSDLLSAQAVLSSGVISSEDITDVSNMRQKIKAKGSLHYGTVRQQSEQSTVGVNTVVFTSEREIQDFNAISPTAVYIADFDGIQFAFSQRRSFYRQAKLYHYTGNAVYSTMETQLISSAADFSTLQVVSNSLPIWLSLNSYEFPYSWLSFPNFTLYPSFAVPDNLVPPYATVHIEPTGTQVLTAAPYLSPELSHHQLTKDTVRITFYGVRNADILTFQDFVNQFTLDVGTLGIMNMPTVRDDKQTQPEFAILAMKKIMDYECSYYQSTARTMSRKLIKQAIPTFLLQAA